MTTGNVPITRPGRVYAHRLVAKTAREMAEVLFEEVMRDNTVYAAHKRICPELTPQMQRSLFVSLMTPHLLENARATLAGMLAGPYPESLKSKISDALILDQELSHHRNRAMRRASRRISTGLH